MDLLRSTREFFGFGKENKSVSLTDELAFEIFGVSPTISGASVTASSALKVPAVLSAIVLITEALGSLPAKVFLSVADGGKRTAKEHPAYRLVHDEANEWTSAGELREQLTADALLHGNGYAVAVRVNGVVQEFHHIADPRTVTVKTDTTTGEPVYEVQEARRKVVYPFRDILRISAPLGIAPIVAGREAIALAITLESCAARLFNGGARPSAIFSNDNSKLGDAGSLQIKNMKAAYRAATATGAFTGPMFLDGMWKYEQPVLSSVDPQFALMRAEQINEIGRLFRIPPHMLFELSRATWSNAGEMYQSFLTLTLRPWMDAWAWAYARCLLSREDRDAGHFIEFVVDDLVTADTATRAETYAKYRASGVLTANEVRAGLNREALPGGDELSNPNITPGRSAANDSKPATVSDLAA